MDKRVALNKGYEISINAEGISATVRVIDEIGRGGTCLVYRGEKITRYKSKSLISTVIIKEFYPVGMDTKRLEDMSIQFFDTDMEEKLKKHFYEGQSNHIQFYEYYSDQSLPRMFVFGEANNTVYAISDSQKGRVLSQVNFDTLSLDMIASIMESICLAIKKIHGKEKLYLDCKPDNFFYYGNKLDLEQKVYLFDFNTIVSLKDINNGRYEFCSASSGWVPVEQELIKDDVNGIIGYKDPQNIGFHTDIYSIGAIFFWLLTSHYPSEADIKSIQNGSFDWEKESKCCSGAERDTLQLVQEIAMESLDPSVITRKERYRHYNSIKTVYEKYRHLRGLTIGDNAHFEPIHKEIHDVKKLLKRGLLTILLIGVLIAILSSVIIIVNRKKITSNYGDNNVETQYQPGFSGGELLEDFGLESFIDMDSNDATHDYYLAYEYEHKGDFKNALTFYASAINKQKEIDTEDTAVLAEMYCSLGRSAMYNSSLDLAIQSLDNSIVSYQIINGDGTYNAYLQYVYYWRARAYYCKYEKERRESDLNSAEADVQNMRELFGEYIDGEMVTEYYQISGFVNYGKNDLLNAFLDFDSGLLHIMIESGSDEENVIPVRWYFYPPNTQMQRKNEVGNWNIIPNGEDHFVNQDDLQAAGLLCDRAMILIFMGCNEEAERDCKDALKIYDNNKEYASKAGSIFARRLLSQAYLGNGDTKEAKGEIDNCINIALDYYGNLHPETAQCYAVASAVYSCLENDSKALDYAYEAYRIYGLIGYNDDEEMWLNNMKNLYMASGKSEKSFNRWLKKKQ